MTTTDTTTPGFDDEFENCPDCHMPLGMSPEYSECVCEDEPEEPTPDTARAEVTALVDALCASFPERREIVWQMLISLIAGQHVLLVGPPGTAKSKLTRAMCGAFDAAWFDTLMGRFQVPAEVMGPIDPKLLAEEGRLTRKADTYLPTAEIAFLDEIYKGSSAILNSLLEAMNEGTWRDDGEKKKMPLRFVVGASNEFGGDEVDAFDDRLLSRFWVTYLDAEVNKFALIDRALPPFRAKCRIESVELLHELAKDLPFDLDAKKALVEITEKCRSEGIKVSDRKVYGQAVDLLKAHAMLKGKAAVTTAMLAPLEHVLWTRPDEIDKVKAIVGAFAASWLADVRDLEEVLTKASRDFASGMSAGGSRSSKRKVLNAINDVVEPEHEPSLREKLETIRKDSPDSAEHVDPLLDTLTNLEAEISTAATTLY